MTKILKRQKPLSEEMEEQLMELHERDLLGLEPGSAVLNRISKTLFVLGMVGVKEYCVNEKRFHGYYITPLGIHYLSNI